jgi:hypothetical protein
LAAVTDEPLWLTEAFQADVTFWPESGNVQATVQFDTASPVLVRSTFATKPPPHWAVTVYVTVKDVAACAGGVATSAVPTRATAAAPTPRVTRGRRDVILEENTLISFDRRSRGGAPGPSLPSQMSWLESLGVAERLPPT